MKLWMEHSEILILTSLDIFVLKFIKLVMFLFLKLIPSIVLFPLFSLSHSKNLKKKKNYFNPFNSAISSSMPSDQIERLIHEADHSIRHILENSLSPKDPIILKMSQKLPFILPTDSNLWDKLCRLLVFHYSFNKRERSIRVTKWVNKYKRWGKFTLLLIKIIK